ncbi:MAG: hypothetical protein QF824_01660 [Candidatus Woesearchaeota archaeon]|jgi:hypothetical protein|nr:hypothetical protein [Candidatus Woesearchaeota archaeon]|tara:strand:- start:572 stop:1255 length:684 start_codon:yes stop_codon:yes gene_type:complete
MSAKFFNGSDEGSKKKKGEGEEIEVAIRVNKKAIERTLYLTTIVILIGVVVFMSINNTKCTTTAGAVISEPENLEVGNNQITTEISEEPEEPTTPEVITEPEDEPVTVVKTEIDAGLRFTSDDITTEGDHPKIKVTEVKYKIVSAGAKFTARVELRWYDKAEEEESREIIHATDEFIISQDATVSRTMDSFTPSYLNSENDDEMFVLKLIDVDTDKEISSKSINFYP